MEQDGRLHIDAAKNTRPPAYSPDAAASRDLAPNEHILFVRPQTGAAVTINVLSARYYYGFYSIYALGGAANCTVNFGTGDLVNATDAVLSTDKDYVKFHSDGHTITIIASEKD